MSRKKNIVTEETKAVVTHSFMMEDTDDNGVFRSFMTCRWSDGSTTFRILTKKPDDVENITRVGFSPKGFELFTGAVIEAASNIESWSLPVSEKS